MPKRIRDYPIYLAPQILGFIGEDGIPVVIDEKTGKNLNPRDIFDKITIYERQVNSCYLKFNISGYTLNYSYQEHINLLIQFLNEACKIMKITSANISLSTRLSNFGTNHYDYFSSNDIEQIEKHGQTFFCVEWLPYNYLLGTEWGNYISADIVARLPELKLLNNDQLNIQYNESGDCIILLNKPIDKMTIKDKHFLKSIFRPALIPGYSIHQLNKVRPLWEQVAINLDEIHFIKEKPFVDRFGRVFPSSEDISIFYGFSDYVFNDPLKRFEFIL